MTEENNKTEISTEDKLRKALNTIIKLHEGDFPNGTDYDSGYHAGLSICADIAKEAFE